MPLQKQPVNINFSQGLNTKVDPFQIPPGQFLELNNTMFSKGGLLQKRNGFQQRGNTLDPQYKTLCTFNGDLTSIGYNIAAYSSASQKFINKGVCTQAELSVKPLFRSNSPQVQVDSVTASNGLICTVYTDAYPSTTYNYVISDSATGQNIISPTLLSTPSESPRVFILGAYFIILWSESANLKYIAISINNVTSPGTATTLVTNYASGATELAFDGVVSNNNLYVAYNASDGGGAIRMTYLNSFLVRQTASTGTIVANAQSCTIMSICSDETQVSSIIWLAFYKAVGTTTYVLAVNSILASVLAKTSVNTADSNLNLTCIAQNKQLSLFYEITGAYTWDATIANHAVGKIIVSQAGTLLEKKVFLYGAGLASKAFILESQTTANNFTGVFASGATTMTVSSSANLFIGQALVDLTTMGNLDIETQITAIDGNLVTFNLAALGASTTDTIAASKNYYFLASYQSAYQPSYFLIDGITGALLTGKVIGKLAYSNGIGYLTKGLPSVTLNGTQASMSYLIKDLVTPVNKNTAVAAGSQIAGIYTQTGINQATWDFDIGNITTAEIGGNLNISSGITRAYDGYTIAEQGFNLWPDLDINADGTYHGLSSATSGGHITDNTKYYYVAVYAWTDNQGNVFRSAPSVPVSITTGASGSNVNTNTLKVPTLRFTSKVSNPVKIEVYRWSVAQPIYYQVTSITSPTLNSLVADSVTVTDTFADATILGNLILYTTGGVVENIGPPASISQTIFKSRLVLIDAEDRNLLWFSKQVIEGTPVEFSDLFTVFVSPTVSGQGSTGEMTAIAAMDDKLIIFKQNALYYMTGTGPDNTGANNDFSDPVFITSTVGCTNQKSIVFTPNGLMFQSDKGIWMLGRDLSTQYIGAAVERYNSSEVVSAVTVPGTNQVRFVLDSGNVLMYDYFFNQWGVFTGISNISSTLFEKLHTFVDSYGRIFQENPGTYLDGSSPVLISFLTGWMNLAGLQGFERAYWLYILASYVSPHKLTVTVAYDYNSSPTQTTVITPDNFGGTYGSTSETPVYGNQSPYGGPGELEQWRVFFQRQKCQSFQIGITESFDSSKGTSAGAGFTMSGMNLTIGLKKAYTTIKSARSVG